MKHGDRDRAVSLARIVLHDNLRIGPGKALERRLKRASEARFRLAVVPPVFLRAEPKPA